MGKNANCTAKKKDGVYGSLTEEAEAGMSNPIKLDYDKPKPRRKRLLGLSCGFWMGFAAFVGLSMVGGYIATFPRVNATDVVAFTIYFSLLTFSIYGVIRTW